MLLAGDAVDAAGEAAGGKEQRLAVGHHLTGRGLGGGHDRDGALRIALVEVLRVGGVEDVEAQVQVGTAVRRSCSNP